MKSLVLPSLQIFVGSKPNDIREWGNRLVHAYSEAEALSATPMLNLDASLIEQDEVPSSGDPQLDARRLDPGSFVPLSSDGVDLLGELQKGRFPDLRFAPRDLLKLADASAGSRNSPAMGCINARYSRAAITQFVGQQLRRILTNRTQIELLDGDVNAAAGNIWVALTFGIVGGTGAAALEVAAMVREVARGLNLPVTIVGVALLPGAFIATSPQRALANSYALKKELQALQSGRAVRAVENSNGELLISQGRAFDVVFLVEDKNAATEQRAQTLVTNGLDGMLGMVSHFLYRVTYTAVGQRLRSRLHDEMADQLASRDEYGHATNFCAFGDAQLYLPERELRLYAPSYLTSRLASKIVGEKSEVSEANALLNRILTNLGLGNEDMTGVLERLTSTTNDDGFPQNFTDVVQARFRRLAGLPLQLRLNSTNAAVEGLERDLAELLDANAPQVAAEMAGQLEAETQQLQHESGLMALIQVADAARRYIDDQVRQAQDDAETYALARKAAQEQRAATEGNLANGTTNNAPAPKPSFWTALFNDGEPEDVTRQRRENQFARNLVVFHQATHDELLLSIELARRTKIAAILQALSKQFGAIADRSREIVAEMGEIKTACDAEAARIENLDFTFQVPVGVCLVRANSHRHDDLEWFTERLLVDDSIDEALAIVQQRYRDEAGDLLKVDDFSALGERWAELFRERFKPHLDAFAEMRARYTPEQIGEYLRLCIRGSSEYLRTNSAVNHDNRHRIRLIGAPEAWHADLQKWLAGAGEANWFLVDSGDATRISFTQVRVGVAMHSVSGNGVEKEAYVRQSERHDEERMHTEPVMRLQPDLDPIQNAADPRLKSWIAMAAASGSLVHCNGSFWHRSWAGEMEKIGAKPSDVTAFLLTHQDHFHEIASRFTTHFKQHGGAQLTSTLLNFAANPNGLANFVDADAVADLVRETEKLALRYGEGPL